MVEAKCANSTDCMASSQLTSAFTQERSMSLIFPPTKKKRASQTCENKTFSPRRSRTIESLTLADISDSLLCAAEKHVFNDNIRPPPSQNGDMHLPCCTGENDATIEATHREVQTHLKAPHSVVTSCSFSPEEPGPNEPHKTRRSRG